MNLTNKGTITKFIVTLIYVFCSFDSVRAQDLNLKIMSFNIQQPFGTNWEARKSNAAAIINTTQADVIGTQEAVNYQRDYLIQQTGYAWYGTGRDGGDSGEGSWIFYKASKYTLDASKSGNFWLSDTPNTPSRFGGSYNRICTYVRLIEKSSGQGFYVFNVHFPTPDLFDARFSSIRLLVDRIANRSVGSDPVYTTGDFNSTEGDAVTLWMKSGSDNPSRSRDTYRDYDPTGLVDTGFGTKFDYIYCPDDAKYITLSSWVIQSPAASDHRPIVAEVSYGSEFTPPPPLGLIPGQIEAELYNRALGVQLENTTDAGGGQNVGYLDANDWLEYDVNVATGENYVFEIRAAANSAIGEVNVLIDGVYNQTISFPVTNGWQTWQTVTKDMDLPAGLHTIRLEVITPGFNLNWFNFFVSTSPTLFIPGKIEAEGYTNAFGVQVENTTDDGGGQNVGYLDTNDWLEYDVNVATEANYIFELRAAGDSKIGEVNVLIDGVYNQTIQFPVTNGWQTWQTVTKDIDLPAGLHIIRFQVVTSGFNLNWFNFLASNASGLSIPGKIEAEDYATSFGTQLENTTDQGGGQNVGYLDVNDFLEYNIIVSSAGSYNFDLRVAAANTIGHINVLLDNQLRQTLELPVTGGWQIWETFNTSIDLPQGNHQLRLEVVSSGFNLNWFNFLKTTSFRSTITMVSDQSGSSSFYPNPTSDYIHFKEKYDWMVFTISGKEVLSGHSETADISVLNAGTYLLHFNGEKEKLIVH